MFAMPVIVFAEEAIPSTATEEAIATESSPTETEKASEGEISSDKAMPDITTDDIAEYIKTYFEEISVVLTLIGTVFYNVRKHKLLNKAISVTNHNAITVSENSERIIAEALETVQSYKNEFAKLLEEYRTNAEERQKLEDILNKAMTYIKTSKLANEEFANELAELLVLANIPNSKKDELYSRHIAAVNAIKEIENTEVSTDDREEA
jgi:hypothetical protein